MTYNLSQAYNPPNNVTQGGFTMKGSVGYDKSVRRYYVSWYHEGKTIKLWYYHADKNIPFRKGKQGKELAQRMLDQMRGDYENNVFRLEKYTNRTSDVIPYTEKWIEAVKPTLAPGTYHDYKGCIKNHFTPFFEKRSVQLHEVQYDVLTELMTGLPLEGKGKWNTMYVLHRCLRYAKKAGRIPVMPDFPEKETYQIAEPIIKWLPSDRQEAVIKAIPQDDQPIFWWLKYHLRRPGEACVLHKQDYTEGVFLVHRGLSYHQETKSTKDKAVHYVPAVSAFLPYVDLEQVKQHRAGIVSPYFFVPASGWKYRGKPLLRYSLKVLNKIWKEACKKTGESIDLYSGLKHSTASQMINEEGYTLGEVQIAGDWATLDAVKKYAKVEVSARKALLERKLTKIGSARKLHDSARNTEEKTESFQEEYGREDRI